MLNNFDIKTVFSFFLKTGMRAKRTKLFFFFSFIPVIIFIIIRIVSLVNPQTDIPVSRLFSQIASTFYFQIFIQILVLFYGSSVLNDEIENKTGENKKNVQRFLMKSKFLFDLTKDTFIFSPFISFKNIFTAAAIRAALNFRALDTFKTMNEKNRQWFSDKRVTPKMIANELYLEPHTVSEMLRRMEKQGLISRKKDLEKKNLIRVILVYEKQIIQKILYFNVITKNLLRLRLYI